MILPWRGVAALHTGGYRGSAQFAARRMEKGRAASWTMEKDVATSPRQTSRMHASYFSDLLQRMKNSPPLGMSIQPNLQLELNFGRVTFTTTV